MEIEDETRTPSKKDMLKVIEDIKETDANEDVQETDSIEDVKEMDVKETDFGWFSLNVFLATSQLSIKESCSKEKFID